MVNGFLLAVLWLCCAGVALGESQLDGSFGDSGLVISDFGLGDDAALDLMVQPDGKIVVAGYVDNGAVKNLAVARYLPDGAFDLDFNATGLFTLSMGNGDTRAESLRLQPDGKIVVVAAVDDTRPGLGVIRLTVDGFLDATFGDNGRVLYSNLDGRVVTGRLAIAADGAIVASAAVGDQDPAAGGDGSLFVKLDQHGGFAADFGQGGIARIELAGAWATKALMLTENGKIVAAGGLSRDGVAEAGLIRLNADGSLDTSYAGESEVLLLPLPGPSMVQAMVVDGDEGLLLTGYATADGSQESFVAKTSPDGELQTDFGYEGVFIGSLSQDNQANAIIRDAGGTILVAGTVSTAESSDIFLLSLSGDDSSSADPAAPEQPLASSEPLSRQAVDGEIQPAAEGSTMISPLLTASYQIVDIGSDQDFGNAIAIAPDGGVLVAGSSTNADNEDFALLRFGGGEETLAAAAAAPSGAVTAGYRITTVPVTATSRVGAVSGGVISIAGQVSCATACVNTCGDDQSCLASCNANCTATSVALRGVVYATVSKPSYRPDEPDDVETETPAEDDAIFPPGSASNYEVVRFGQTEDGSGTGEYGSDIQGITPNTRYYVRAYAVLGNGRVLYGNELTFTTDDACFIASAAYGSILHQQVVVLRTFRDRFLLPSPAGRQLVGLYYRVSPAIAEAVAGHDLLRWTVRLTLAPVILFAMLALQTTPMVSLGLLAALLAALAVGVRASTRRWGSTAC